MKDSPVNSEYTTIRSLIVLLFLIGLPVVAIMPEGVQGALRGFLPHEPSDSPAASVPPARGGESLPSFPVLQAPNHTDDLPPVIRLADFETSPESNSPVKPTEWEADSPFDSASRGMNRQDDLPRPSELLTSGEMVSDGMINEKTNTIQAELDRLGATYYRLESWGSAPRVYRFHCTVTIKIGLAEYSRNFEASAESPQEAMQNVRHEVQTWHDRFSSGNPMEMEPMGASPRMLPLVNSLVDILQGDMRAFHFEGIRRESNMAIEAGHGSRIAPHIWGNEFGLLMQIHAACALPNFYCAEPDPGTLQGELLGCDGYQIKAGRSHHYDAPGLGVEVNLKTLASARIVHEAKA